MLIDSRCAANMAGATQTGMAVGVYHSARPHTNSALDEAQHFLTVARNYVGPGYLPPALRIEDSANGPTANISKAALSQWIRAWCSAVESITGVKPMLCVTPWFARERMENDLAQYSLWIVNYTVPPEIPTSPDANPSNLGPWNSSWTFMQYAITGTAVDGVPNPPVALDVFNGNAEALSRFAFPVIKFTGVGGGAFQPPSAGRFQCEVYAPGLVQVVVQASVDLVNWSDASTLSLVNGRAVFTDTNAVAHTKRFYRPRR